MNKFGVIVFAVFTAASTQAAAIDDFNRPDSPTLGAAWTQQAGVSGIAGNAATGSDLSLATYDGLVGSSVSFDIADVGDGTQYIAAIIGYGAGDNYFVKVQNNGGSQGFNTLGFYTGNNGGGLFQGLSSSFLTGHVDVSVSGTIATLTINPTAGATQVYSYDYGYSFTGTGLGLGFYGNALADNFGGDGAAGAVPEPASWALMLGGFGLIGGAMRRRKLAAVRFG